jgi:phosphoserine phosphatase RsbU/P
MIAGSVYQALNPIEFCSDFAPEVADGGGFMTDGRWNRDRAAGSQPEIPPASPLISRGGGFDEVHPGPPQDPDSLTGQQEDNRILTLLYDIGRELTSILDLETLLLAVARRVKRLVDYDLFNVMLFNPETGRLGHAFSLRYDQRLHVRTTLGLGEGLCGTAARERKSIRVDRVANDPRYIRCEAGLDIESELVIPLLVQDRLLGVLDLESLEADSFTEENEKMLSAVASTIAIAIENACLYDKLRKAEQRRKEDLERAREVQQQLLPADLPRIPGIEVAVHYHPAQELGGDFYDFLQCHDGKLAIAVGDVSGKGSAAALLASLGVGILREHILHSPSAPAEMLADLNGHLQITGQHGRFITMAFAIYDPASGELSLTNAGFPRPILLRAGKAVPVNVTGLPLGLFPDISYEAVLIGLQPGDVLVFCSDGIHEQTNPLDEEFGVARLIERLSNAGEGATAEKIVECISSAIEAHAGTNAGCADCRDDRTIVVLRMEN